MSDRRPRPLPPWQSTRTEDQATVILLHMYFNGVRARDVRDELRRRHRAGLLQRGMPMPVRYRR